MRAGDGNRKPQPHQPREHLGARNHGHAAALRLDDLRVARLHRRRDDDHLRLADVFRAVPLVHLHAELLLEPPRHRRALHVRAAHLEAEVRQQLGDPAHADATNADEVDPFSAPEQDR